MRAGRRCVATSAPRRSEARSALHERAAALYKDVTKRGVEREKTAVKAGDELHGFRVLGVKQVPEFDLEVTHLEHVRTGAQHVHADCSDMNNGFACVRRAARCAVADRL